MDPVLLLVAAAVVGYKLARHWLRPRPVDRPPPRMAAPPPDRPALRPLEWAEYLRGAHLTTEEAVREYLASRVFAPDGEPEFAFWLANLMLPVSEYLNRVHLITGGPSAGKSVMEACALASICRLFRHPHRRLRLVVIDPTGGEYKRVLHQCVPPDVPVIDATPQSPHSWRWDVRSDVGRDDDWAKLFVSLLFPESLFKESGDGRFWYTMARQVTLRLIWVFLDRGSDYRFGDLLVPFEHPQFLVPTLLQSKRTRGFARHTIVGRLGRDITATASGVLSDMATAAAQWSHAARTFSLREFLSDRAVLYLAYTPRTIPSNAGIANALVHMLVTLGLDRRDKTNHTIVATDETHYMKDVGGLDELAAFGRASGFGWLLNTHGIPQLMRKFGREKVEDLLEILGTWTTFKAGRRTAEEFCKLVGQFEVYQKGTSRGEQVTDTEGWSVASGPQGQTLTESWSRAVGYSAGETWSLVTKDALLTSEVTGLRDADVDRDWMEGYFWNNNLGCAKFGTPFLKLLATFPPLPYPGELLFPPDRPQAEKALGPWDNDDIDRLNLRYTPEMKAALRASHGRKGGRP